MLIRPLWTTAAFPASAAFDIINQALSDEAERKDAIKKGAGIYTITLKNKDGKEQSWYVDLKDKGKVFKGEAPAGGKADGMCQRLVLRIVRY